MYVAFRFWCKINYSRGHQQSFSRKSLDLSFLSSTYDKILKYISKALLFAWSRFCHTPQTTWPPLLLPWFSVIKVHKWTLRF